MSKIKKSIIGLTGGIATGKSTALLQLKKCGAEVIDSDSISRNLLHTHPSILKKISQSFGDSVIRKDGKLNRKKLAKIIFSDTKARKKLNAIMHPAIIKELQLKISHSNAKVVVVDIPLLFEAHLEKLVDYIWVIYSSEKLQLQRLMKRNHLSKTDALLRIHSQWPTQIKCKLADACIKNDSSIENLRNKIKKNYQLFISKNK